MAKKSSKAKKTRRYIPRQTRKFQLRLDDPKDRHVGEILDYARSQRREVTVIREAVALYWALENGNLEVLFEKFPQYRAHFKPDTSDLIEQFRQLLNQKGRAEQIEAAPTLSGPKLLAGTKQLPTPASDDDDLGTLVFKKSETAATDASTNFFNQIAGYVQPAGHQ